jgi:uncharacterized protein YjbJ (UPF0337 family)
MANSDILAGNWNQFKGKALQFWGKLTDDDVDQINGRVMELSGILQKKYGYRRDEAEREIDKFLAEQDD